MSRRTLPSINRSGNEVSIKGNSVNRNPLDHRRGWLPPIGTVMLNANQFNSKNSNNSEYPKDITVKHNNGKFIGTINYNNNYNSKITLDNENESNKYNKLSPEKQFLFRELYRVYGSLPYMQTYKDSRLSWITAMFNFIDKIEELGYDYEEYEKYYESNKNNEYIIHPDIIKETNNGIIYKLKKGGIRNRTNRHKKLTQKRKNKRSYKRKN
jgi:hypothetical protein